MFPIGGGRARHWQHSLISYHQTRREHRWSAYTITQVNGQRIYGPPPDWTGPPPPKGCEVFVGKLPRGIYEDVIIPLFEQIGRIYQVRLLMDFSGTNRGYCFVHFTSPEDARMAIFKMDGYEICKGRFLGVVKSIDNCRLFVGGVPKTRTKEEITEEISRHVEGVIETILYNSVVNKRINRGFAFVEFESHRAAAVARRKFMTGKYLLWNQTEISVDWAEPEREVDARVMSKTSEKRIQSAIEEVVESKMIERIKKMRDFAFIHFADRKSAEAAKIYWHTGVRGFLLVLLSSPPSSPLGVSHGEPCDGAWCYLRGRELRQPSKGASEVGSRVNRPGVLPQRSGAESTGQGCNLKGRELSQPARGALPQRSGAESTGQGRYLRGREPSQPARRRYLKGRELSQPARGATSEVGI
uniref:RRM domain-containing protein n=1 Tax=Timema genevievae TaxID=629358 RepID=A0A7R9JXU3_TIMGE|nr:unnamed protein product [Timema genevievae]